MECQPRNQEADDVVDALANGRRRAALCYLFRRDGTVPLADLSAHVASREQDRATDVSPASISAALVHAHLPKLAEVDLVEYDRTARQVSLGSRAVDVRPVLDAVERTLADSS